MELMTNKIKKVQTKLNKKKLIKNYTDIYT